MIIRFRSAAGLVASIGLLGCEQMAPCARSSVSAEPTSQPSAVANDPPRADELLETACAAIQALDSLEMRVRVQLNEGLLFGRQPEVIIAAAMRRDGRWRVRAERDGKPVGELAGDGATTREWVASRAQWTQYSAAEHPPILTIDMAGQPKLRFALEPFVKNWLGESGYFCTRLRRMLDSAEGYEVEAKVGRRELNGHDCNVLEVTAGDSRDGMRMEETIRVALDRATNMPVLEEEIARVAAVGFPLQRITLTRTYDRVERNPGLSDSALVFAPPPGSQFVDRESLRVENGLKPGQAAPPAVFRDLDDRDVSLLEKCRNGPVLLVFWATWCLPCKQELADLQELTKDESLNRKLTVLAVSTDDSVGAVEAFVAGKRQPFPVLHDADGARKQFGGTGVPATYLIDSKGVIRGRWNGWSSGRRSDETLAEIRKLAESLR